MAEVAPKSGEFNEGKLWFTRKLTTVTLGVTTAAVDEVGEIESLELPDEGGDFDKGEVIATIEGSKGSIELMAPAAGIIQEVNTAAKDSPEVVAEDPLEEGWLVKLEIQDTSDLKEFAAD